MNNNLIILLENILENVKNNKYNQTYTTYLSELIQKFNFVVEMNSNENVPKRDVINFLSLGWYIYNNLIETN
tara:strand:+ start:371 stop:586 length:216 start_codon:yes stop_codon:yes gene_type:complete